MTRWADRGYFLGGPTGPVGMFSPDGAQFVVLVKKGNLSSNENQSSLLLFRTRDAFQSPRPKLLLSMSSSSNRDAIRDVKWLRDGKTIAFLGENKGEPAQVYVFNTISHQLQKLTNHRTSIVAYDISDSGREIVYEAEPPPKPALRTVSTRKFGVVITTQFPDDLLIGDCDAEARPWSAGAELFRQERGRSSSRIATEDFVTEYEPLSLSGDGRYALLAVLVKDPPREWSEYQDKLLHPYLVEQRKIGGHSHLARYMTLDMHRGTLTPLLDTPMPWINAGFAWTGAADSLVISAVYLPLNVPDPLERDTREKQTFVVAVRIPGREITKITDKPVKVIGWDARTKTVILGSEDSSVSRMHLAYQKDGSSWSEVPSPTEEARMHNPVNVSLEEDMNSPPKIYVSSENGRRRSLLFDMNPQFAQLNFGKEEAVSWKSTDGHTVLGGLYLPPHYTIGAKYPLVIQTHGFRKDRFWIDGPWSGAFSAQALASHGIIVLQVGGSEDPKQDEEHKDTPAEGSWEMGKYEGAIDYLDKRGLVDRSRLGIIGFSRTVYGVAYTLTHSKYQFAAASLADGFDGGYVNYILWGGADSVAVNGGLPFGDSLPKWLRNSPGFNLEKVHAAVHIEEYGMGTFLGGWQWFSGLSALDKPVDFLWFPFGTHLLVKPWERMASQQRNVDWFLFWLKGIEDPNPWEPNEYPRWRELRGRRPEIPKDVQPGVSSLPN